MAAKRRAVKRIRYTEPTCDNWSELSEDERVKVVQDWPLYYKEHYGKTQLRKFFVKWATKVADKKDHAAIKAGLSMSTYLDGAWAQIILRGYSTDLYADHLIQTRLPLIIEHGNKVLEESPTTSKPDGARTPTIQERIADRTRDLLGQIEYEIDVFLSNGCKKPKFELYRFLQKNDVKGPHTKRIREHLDKVLDELVELIGGKDDQLNEGYAFLSKSQQTKYRDFIRTMVGECDSHMDMMKAKRKPRTKKAKSAKTKVSKVNYKKSDDEYKIASVDPSKLVDATQVWLFDTKNRFLHRYVSDRGMVVKGTTLYEYDKEKSFRKKVRKPDKILPEVLNGGKVKLRKLMDEIRAKETKVTGRINGDMVIVRVV